MQTGTTRRRRFYEVKRPPPLCLPIRAASPAYLYSLQLELGKQLQPVLATLLSFIVVGQSTDFSSVLVQDLHHFYLSGSLLEIDPDLTLSLESPYKYDLLL
jgi:hypothetical protein